MPRTGGLRRSVPGRSRRPRRRSKPSAGDRTRVDYALAARRHMHEFGTTSAQLAEIKVAASLHAAAQSPCVPARPGDRRGGARLAADRRPAAPARLLRGHRRGRCSRGRQRRRSPATSRAERQGARARRSVEAHRQRARSTSPTPARRGPGPRAFEEAGVHAGRHRLRVDLRLVHDHRPRVRSKTSASARRAKAAASCSDGALRGPARPASLQHRRRRPVQQPSRRTAAA